MENIKRRQLIVSIAILAVIVILILVLFIALIPMLSKIMEDHGNDKGIVDSIHAYGIKGVPVVACLQALQVVLTVIPAALIQVPAGLCYGMWKGTCICIAGSIIGNMLVFAAQRELSNTLRDLFGNRRAARREKKKSSKPGKKSLISADTLDKMKRPELVAFYVYLIPGIPNGMLPYIFARTKVRGLRFLAAVAAGNIPSTIVCTLAGERISRHDYIGAGIIIGAFLLLVLVAFLFRKRIMDIIQPQHSD